MRGLGASPLRRVARDGVVRTCWFPFCLGRADADTGGMSGDRRRDTEEPGRQQVCYLSQSEAEGLASRPCRMRGCPRHEGTQGLRSLWAKRTEPLSVGAGPRQAPCGHRHGAVGPPPTPLGRKTPQYQQGVREGLRGRAGVGAAGPSPA